jgi:hypothetical protein
LRLLGFNPYKRTVLYHIWTSGAKKNGYAEDVKVAGPEPGGTAGILWVHAARLHAANTFTFKDLHGGNERAVNYCVFVKKT